jgi:hypothetical protein
MLPSWNTSNTVLPLLPLLPLLLLLAGRLRHSTRYTAFPKPSFTGTDSRSISFSKGVLRAREKAFLVGKGAR